MGKKTSEQRFKSDRFQGFDMFAPKTPKLQVKKPPLHLNQTPKQIFTPPSPVIGASGTPTSAGSVSLKSVPSSPGTPVSTSGSKPVFSEKKAANASTSNTPSTHGQPKVVRGNPEWLSEKLSLWNLNRKDVEIVTEASKIRKRRIYTEEEYDLKCGVEPPKVAKVVLDKNIALDDIEAQLAQLESHDSAD